MPRLIRFALGVELALVIIENLFPVTHGVLPIGGRHLAQIGVALGLPAIYYHLVESFHTRRRR
jgi:hypothetical protein